MADVASTLRLWSGTAASNSPAGGTAIGAGLDDNLREIQAVVRKYLASSASDMASGTTVDLATADGYYINITGTTTITALGTEAAGIHYLLKFAGALTFTHNGTSLILPTGASITTAAGDLALMVSEGSGNWRCAFYQRADGTPVAGAATQANQETGTSTTTYVSPGRQQYHPSACKAWGMITPDTTVTVSYPAAGVSVVKNGAGDFTVTHGVTFSSTNYAAVVTQEKAALSTTFGLCIGRTATTVRFVFTDTNGNATDPTSFSYMLFGDI